MHIFFTVVAFLGNVLYLNNSVVTLSDIGEDWEALFCYTNLTTCCRSYDNFYNGAIGNWWFPNGTRVGSKNCKLTSNKFSRTRSIRTVILHHEINANGPFGIFTCQILDSDYILQQLYFGIYNETSGECHECILLLKSDDRPSHFPNSIN